MNTSRSPRRFVAPILAGGALLMIPAAATATTGHPSYQPSCYELGYEHELKVDPPGVASDGAVSVEVKLRGALVDWTSSKPIGAVIVSDGHNAKAYVYAGGSSGDSGLHAPYKYDYPSRVDFCYDDEQPPPVEPPPAEQPPVDEPPPVAEPPAVQPPALTPAVVQAPPVSSVRAVEVRSGRSRLRGPSGCVGRRVRATVSGRAIARVVLRLDGKRVKAIDGPGSYSVQSSSLSAGIHRIRAKVSFKAAAATRSRTHVVTFQRCVVRRVAPRFAG